MIFTPKDRAFLLDCGIDPGPAPKIARPDGTVRLLEKFGIPVTRENYLRLAFAGNPPQEPLDGEIEAELPIELQNSTSGRDMDHIETAPSAGDCGEPNRTTPLGRPLCSKCGKSTRNKNRLVCKPCRARTRLLLTDADKQLLREMGISR